MRPYKLCRTEKNRKQFADEVVALADRLGVTAAVYRDPQFPRETRVTIWIGHYMVGVEFECEMPLNVFTADWNLSHARIAEDLPHFPKGFNRMIRADDSQEAGHKATSEERTFEGLLLSLEGGIKALIPIVEGLGQPVRVEPHSACGEKLTYAVKLSSRGKVIEREYDVEAADAARLAALAAFPRAEVMQIFAIQTL